MTLPFAGRGLRAVIFDMDGLLVDTGPIWRDVGNELFASLGVDISAVAASGVVLGVGVREAMAVFRSFAGWTPLEHADLEARMVARVVDAIADRAELMPGALEALDLVASYQLPAALASGSTRPVIDAVLDRFGLATRFAAVCSSADEQWGKPHPAVFLRAAATLGVAPRACLVVEDAVNGCIAAKAAGMHVVAVPDGPAAGDPRFVIADLVLGSLKELSGDAARDALRWAASDELGAPGIEGMP